MVTLTRTLAGIRKLHRTLSPSDPPEDYYSWQLLSACHCGEGYCEVLHLRLCCFDANRLSSLFVVGTILRRVKSAHCLVHIDDLRWLDVTGSTESDDGFAEGV